MADPSYIVEVDRVRMEIPADLLFTDSHLWARRGEGRHLVIGLTEPHVALLGGVAFLEYRVQERDTVCPEDVVAVLEAYKTTSLIKSPLAGTVVEVNPQLPRKTRFLETDPYGRGWLFTLDTGSGDAQRLPLLDAKSYYELILNDAAQRSQIGIT